MDVRDTFKADEAEGRSWLRALIQVNPFASVLIAFVAGFATGALVLGLL